MARVGNVPTVSAYKGNIGQQLMHVGNTLDDISQKYEKKQVEYYQQHQHCDTLAAADQANHGHLRRAGAQHRGAGDDHHRRADHQDQISGADPLQAGTHWAERPEVQNV